MKRSISTLFIFALTLCVSAPIFAQQRPGNRGGERGPQQQTERFNRMQQMQRQMEDVSPELRSEAHIYMLDKYVNLSSEQETQIKEINAEFAALAEELREEPIHRQRKAIEARDLKKEHHVAVYDVLTKEQYKAFLIEREAIQIEIRDYIKEQIDG